MAIKLIIAVYFALVATMFAAGVVMLSLHDMQESRFSALDNSHLVARQIFGVPFMDIAWFGVIILLTMIWIVLDI